MCFPLTLALCRVHSNVCFSALYCRENSRAPKQPAKLVAMETECMHHKVTYLVESQLFKVNYSIVQVKGRLKNKCKLKFVPKYFGMNYYESECIHNVIHCTLNFNSGNLQVWYSSSLKVLFSNISIWKSK